MPRGRYRILALDVDGTLLDRDGTLSPRTSDAVSRATRAGIRPVLCTGRRFRRALPIAERLGLDTPLVCNSGAIVKGSRDHRTLWRADLPQPVVDGVFEVFRSRDEPAVSFMDRGLDESDFVVTAEPSGRPLFDDYLGLNRPHAEVDPHWINDPTRSHYHICAIGTNAAMEAFESAILGRVPEKVQTFVQKSTHYAGTMCEILRRDANKWTALLRLAELWGVEPGEICAAGDDRNDVPMLRGAGLGVAMAHASPEIREAADVVAPDEEGVAWLIDRILLT